MYLAAIKDMATREIVGWSMADHLRGELACDALVMALQRRRPEGDLIHHSDRGVQGGFKWPSQHLDGGVGDGHAEAAFGSVGARRVALAGPARGGAARGPAAVLDGDRGGAVQRGRGGWGRCVVGGGGTMVPGGGRHATIDAGAVVEAALGAVPVVRGTRGGRAVACAGARGAGGRPTARAGGVDDLARAAAQRCDAGRRRSAGRGGGGREYRAPTARGPAERAARRPKPAKLATNPALRAYVRDRL